MLKSFLFAFLVSASLQSNALTWHWHDSFTAEEVEKMEHWITESNRGVSALFGQLPYEPHIHFNRVSNAREPVPWANTRKYRFAEVHLHVDPSFSLQALRSDWTAAHELSHLLFPYLGRQSRWFAEGIASYLQYQIMYASGVLTWNEAVEKIDRGFDRGRNDMRAGDMPIARISQRCMMAPRRLYWGGAAYFLTVDQKLATSDQRLHDVVRAYLNCCWRMHRGSAETMMVEFDRLSGTTVFADTYTALMLEPGFPETRSGLAWLRENAPSLGDWIPTQSPDLNK